MAAPVSIRKVLPLLGSRKENNELIEWPPGDEAAIVPRRSSFPVFREPVWRERNRGPCNFRRCRREFGGTSTIPPVVASFWHLFL